MPANVPDVMTPVETMLMGAGLMAFGWAFGFVMGWIASDRYGRLDWFLPPSMNQD